MQNIPQFNLKLIFELSKEDRMSTELSTHLETLHYNFVQKLNVKKIIASDNNKYLAIWLDKEIEIEIANKWEQDPSLAYLYNIVALALCMTIVNENIPEIKDCAPMPFLNKPLLDSITEYNLPYVYDGESLTPNCAYSTLTYLPYRGNCNVCFMQDSCTRK